MNINDTKMSPFQHEQSKYTIGHKNCKENNYFQSFQQSKQLYNQYNTDNKKYLGLDYYKKQKIK